MIKHKLEQRHKEASADPILFVPPAVETSTSLRQISEEYADHHSEADTGTKRTGLIMVGRDESIKLA